MQLNSLPQELQTFVEQQVAAGQFATPESVMVEAVRRMAANQKHNGWVRARIAEADQSLIEGDVLDLDDAEWDELFLRIERGEEITLHRVGQ